MSGLAARVLSAAYQFPGIQQIAFVRRTWWDGEKKASEGRYFITSIARNRLSAKRFLQMTISHWEIENSLHNVKDKHWNEDKQMTKRRILGSVQACLRNLSLNILRVLPDLKKVKSLTAKAMQLLAQPLQAFHWLAKV